MKKFLSVLLTMAMVMSLFTGTVLAATPADVTITAGTASVEIKLLDFAATNDKLTYVIKDSANVVKYATPAGTQINVTEADILTINTANLTLSTNNAQEVYVLTITNVTDATTDAVNINVRHVLTINDSTSNPKATPNANNVFTGTLKTANGSAVANMAIDLFDGAAAVASTVTGPDGSFTLNAYIGTAANYSVRVATVAYKQVVFDAVDDLTVKNVTYPGTIRSASLPLNVTMSFTAKTGTTALAGTEFNLFNLTLPDGTVKASTAVVWDAANKEYDVTFNFAALADYKAGTYTVNGVMYVNNPAPATKIADATDAKPYRSGTTTFTVTDNTNVLYTTATVGGATKDIPVKQAAQAVALGFTSPAGKFIKKVTYKVEGPVVATQSQTVTLTGSATEPYMTNVNIPTADLYGATDDPANVAVAGKTIVVNGDGVIKITGTVTYSDDTTETFEKAITVNGYMAEYSPAELGNVGDEIELSVVVTTEAGVPVNNALVTWTSTDYAGGAVNAIRVWNSTDSVYNAAVGTTNVNGQNTIVQNGVYTKKIKLAAPAIITVTVHKWDSTTNAWGVDPHAFTTERVYGAPVYTVDAVSDLIATKAGQTVTFTMKNADGIVVKPTYVYVEDTNAVSGVATGVIAAPTYDGNKVQITFAPTKTGTFNVLFGTEGGNKMISAPVKVVAPVVTVTVNGVESSTVTAGVRDKVVLTFANTSASQIDTTPTITANTLNGQIFNGTTAAAVNVDPMNTVTGVVTFYPEYAIYSTVTDGKLEIQASFNGGANYVTVATLTVAAPKLDLAGVKTLEVGSVVDLQLTLTDANGKPMKGYEIKATDGAAFAGNATVTTDDNGKASLSVSPTAVGKLTLQVQTLDSVFNSKTAAKEDFSVTIPVNRDNAGPVIALEEVYSVTSPNATISFTVTDGSKVSEVWVGYEKLLVRPDGTVRFDATNLKVGINEFEVIATDGQYNSSAATLVVEYLKPATVVLTIGSTDATKDGAAMTGMDQAPTIVNGRTFLPVRFVFVNLLGGTIEWDATTQTITSVVKGNTIKMVVGSKTAFVNGNAVALLEAPYIEAATGRTLVPMREIMEAIGISLTWNATTQTVSIVIPQ